LSKKEEVVEVPKKVLDEIVSRFERIEKLVEKLAGRGS